jgi:hypothetical protein
MSGLHGRSGITPGLLLLLGAGALLVGPRPVRAQVNQPPDVTLPNPAPDTTLGTPVSFAVTVSDPDVGGGNMEMEIDISDRDGVGGRSVVAGDWGRFTWGFGASVTSDVELRTLAQLNAALANFTYTPPPGFAGIARVIFEIDDQGNTGTGGELARTRIIDIDVCAPSELGTAACAVNNQPDVTLPGPQATPVDTPLGFVPVISDVDAGNGPMEMEIDISDLDGAGPLSVPNGDYGRFSWGFGSNVTSDIAVATLAQINTALASFTYTPPPGYIGQARIIFEIDDQGSSGEVVNVLARTRFIDIQVQAAPGQLRFGRGCVVSHGEGVTVTVPVVRFDGSSGAASVEVDALPGSATAPADFSLANTALAWSADQAGTRNAQLQIAADGLAERTESLTLLLANANGAALGEPSAQTVFLRDVPGATLVFVDGLEGDCLP